MIRIRIIAVLCALFFCRALPARAQEAAAGPAGMEPAGTEAASAAVPLPRNFRSLSLGMSLDDLKAGLAGDGLFNFRGDRDVSFLPRRDQSLIETTGSSFIRRAFFQLYEGRVFIMGFALNTAIVDHYSVFTSLVKKYGEPSAINPREAVWETDDTRVSIERPLTVKYMDMRVFSGIMDEAVLAESREIRLREEFLDEF
ncbi:MAG: hypothetical protein LBG42_05365 [Treponema sp.]|jgi:hypothetical protein|nr:hypothetical protein [Treponema sp.]